MTAEEPHACSPERVTHSRCHCCGVWFVRRDEGPQAIGYCGHSCYDANRFRQVEPEERWDPKK